MSSKAVESHIQQLLLSRSLGMHGPGTDVERGMEGSCHVAKAGVVAAGISWNKIGVIRGTSAQAAQQRYGEEV